MDPSYNSNVSGPVSPTPQPTISSGGDIFLPPSQPTMTVKKSKKPLAIAIIIILAVAAAGVVVWWLVSQTSKNTVKNFDSFKAYLYDGDENEKKSDYIYAISIAKSPTSKISSYYETLNSKYAAFTKSASDKTLDDYGSAYKALVNIVNHDKVLQDIIAVYRNNGAEAAQKSFDDRFSYFGDNANIKALYSLQASYYDSALSEFIIYETNKCNEPTMYNYTCMLDRDSESLQNLRNIATDKNTALSKMTNELSLSVLNSIMTTSTQNIEGKIK